VTPLPRPVNWIMGRLLGVSDRNLDLVEGMRATLARLRKAAES
jgi:hypothetical protein